MTPPATLEALVRKVVKSGARISLEREGAPQLTKNGDRYSAMIVTGRRGTPGALAILPCPAAALRDALERFVTENFSEGGAMLPAAPADLKTIETITEDDLLGEPAAPAEDAANDSDIEDLLG